MKFTVDVPDENISHDVPAELEDKLDIEGREKPIEKLNALLKDV